MFIRRLWLQALIYSKKDENINKKIAFICTICLDVIFNNENDYTCDHTCS